MNKIKYTVYIPAITSSSFVHTYAGNFELSTVRSQKAFTVQQV